MEQVIAEIVKELENGNTKGIEKLLASVPQRELEDYLFEKYIESFTKMIDVA